MMGAAHRWVFAGLIGLGLAAANGALADEVKVTDKDRLFRNFTREAAVVDQGQIRLELRGMSVHEESADHETALAGRCQGPLRENCTRLNVIGQRIIGVESLSGGTIDLLASYGVAPGTEIGAILPGNFETLHRDDGSTESYQDIGDMTLYGKFKYAVHEMVSVAGGLELTPPTGTKKKIDTVRGTGPDDGIPHDIDEGTVSGSGTGSLGINPFVSSRFQWRRLGVEAHVGYNFYSSGKVERVFNWSAAGFIRGGEMWAFRTEISGRIFDQFGTRWVDVVCMPGLDINLTKSFTVRPTGLANITGTALDWGMGVGLALTL